MMFTSTLLACVCGSSASVAKLDWEDCGDATTHTILTDLTPTELPLGATTTVTGSGILDETQDGGSFKFKATLAGVPVTTGSGDLCKGADLSLPLGVGKIAIKPMACPVVAGDASLVLDITLASLLTQDVNSLVKVDIAATTTSGDKFFCMKINVDTPKQAEDQPLRNKTCFEVRDDDECNARDDCQSCSFRNRTGCIDAREQCPGVMPPHNKTCHEIRDDDECGARDDCQSCTLRNRTGCFDTREQCPGVVPPHNKTCLEIRDDDECVARDDCQSCTLHNRTGCIDTREQCPGVVPPHNKTCLEIRDDDECGARDDCQSCTFHNRTACIDTKQRCPGAIVVV